MDFHHVDCSFLVSAVKNYHLLNRNQGSYRLHDQFIVECKKKKKKMHRNISLSNPCNLQLRVQGIWFHKETWGAFGSRNLMEFDRIGMTNSMDQIPWSSLVHGMLTKKSFKFLQHRISSFHTITRGIHWNLPSPLSFSPSMVFSFQILLRFGLGFRFF